MVAVQTARFGAVAHGARFARETLHNLGLAPHEIDRLFDRGITSEPSARPRSGQSGPAV